MSTRAQQHTGTVVARDEVTPHLVRLTLEVPGFTSTGIADEWVGLVVPGQFQSRYYTVRSHEGSRIVLDVVVHEVGLVTEWALGDPVGQQVTITEAKGSFAPPADASWLLLVGDLTALPAMARIAVEHGAALPTRVVAEVPADSRVAGYFPDTVEVSWLPGDGESRLAEVVAELDWPEGPGYFWMAGESAQMRAIRKHLMRERKLPSTHYDVMGYWRSVTQRQPRAVDPGPIWRAGKAAGKSDEEIWADYDAAQGAQQ
ncbi:siderophore-interacting protein [Nocardioides sp. zg-536]|uniref:Siderophore-interacting protein n=1 Tax=Nocardioides faecalis TaxID=2803858 RepID=A0A938Y6R4_9ACTN|nr:siderophore-interacting protein [Nocardioides faecalis]MBM9460295.1 siderophore-interacting protein [Nocardioides faecalis]MBS4751220.1 siderophore-interacting protein [Nocardioides faecalis]QVI59870.1 siderophore-interacting protein [Nocardioides faecalis]